MTSEALAHLSNNLLYSAMAVYAVAMYCYAAELAFGTPRRRSAEQSDRELVAVGASPAYDVPGPTVATDEDAERLARAGILYAPDFVINAGGLINVYNELLGGYNRERALRMTRGIYLNLTRVFETAKRDGITTAVAADRVAEERIATVRKLGSKHWGRLLAR